MFNLVINGALPTKRIAAAKFFIGQNKSKLGVEATALFTKDGIRYQPFVRNLFLPIALGGLGFQCPVGFKFRMTAIQKRVASSLIGDLRLDMGLPIESDGLPRPVDKATFDYRDNVLRFPTFDISSSLKMNSLRKFCGCVLSKLGKRVRSLGSETGKFLVKYLREKISARRALISGLSFAADNLLF